MKKFLIPFFILTASLFSTQTAFWRPYKTDNFTYALFHFDKNDFSDFSGKIKNVSVKGNVKSVKGKFGNCAEFDGKGVIKYETDEIFPGGYISMEAWIKVKKYPEEKAYIIFRPAKVDRSAKYNPEVDKTKGFSLYIDSKGGFHMSITNTFYGRTTTTSSPEGIIPLNKWVHIAGISANFPVKFRRLYLNGKEVFAKPIEWGQGITVHKDEEIEPSPIYIGNNREENSGFDGLIDEVRIHRNIFKFWEKGKTEWTDSERERKIERQPPFFLPSHTPVFYLSLDGGKTAQINKTGKIEIIENGKFIKGGIRGEFFRGSIKLRKEKILNLDEGSIEFWFQPYGVNNYSDRNVSFLNVWPGFNFYIFNGGAPGRPLSVYFKKDKGDLKFISSSIDVYEGKWYHVVITWKGKEIKVYIDGKKRAESFESSFHTKWNEGYANEVNFRGKGRENFYAEFDEIYLYDKALTEDEVKNAYLRYRDKSKLIKGIKVYPAEIKAQYIPGFNTIYYKIIPETNKKIGKIRFELFNQKGKLFSKIVSFSEKEEKIKIPSLDEGKYTLKVYVEIEGEYKEGKPFEFIRKKFVWEGNNLGITEKVPEPFKPVKVEGNKVKVVLREYYMNGFGLFDKVITKGMDILSEPIRIKGKTEKGEIKWGSVRGKFVEKKEPYCIYKGKAISDFIEIKTKSTIEFDGCMKVEMEIKPGKSKSEIKKLFIEIPVKEKYAVLFHEVTDGPRINYSGRLPEGKGIIWDSTKAKRSRKWLNSFVPYIWIGREERGIAWFGENDKGWITEKDGGEKAIQEIIRENGKVIIRIYLINKPAVLTKSTHLVFGLQASPTKPMPEKWREKLPYIPGGLAVTPWGGLHCSYQGPYRDDWQIVDKIIECRYKGKVDEETKKWFEEYNKKYNPPPTYGTWKWISNVLHFAGGAARVGPEKPMAVYQEEMAASTVRDEWKTYQDEWTVEPYLYKRKWPEEEIFRRGRNTGPAAKVNFIKSYQDFGVWYANEWLKRGVSLYWDNTYPHISCNFRTTDAYKADDKIQPCVIIWNQREYQKRVYSQLVFWRKRRKEPLEWVVHMTNTLLLPVHTFATADLDHELGSKKPFPPDWLRTETIGRQVGNYPLSLYPVSGSKNEIIKKLPEEKQKKIEWGMRMVHEIQRRDSKWEKIVREFGYGKENVKICNYWSEKPVIKVNNEKVKWICLLNKDRKEIMIVLSSWDEKDLNVNIKFFSENTGFDIDKNKIIDVENKEKVNPENIKLKGPYGIKILKLEG